MIEFFFDCSSPWTYLAFHNIQPLAKEFGEQISWLPVLVGGIFNAINPSVYASRENPVAAKVRRKISRTGRGWRDSRSRYRRLPGKQHQSHARLSLAWQRRDGAVRQIGV